MRTVWVDADGCPVVAQTIALCQRFAVECVLVCDTAHEMERAGARTIVVSQGADSADYALVNRVAAGDVVVTQDYGLAAMCLAKRAVALNQNGLLYTADNIDALLLTRHLNRKQRAGGGRVKGPPKRRSTQDDDFCAALTRVLQVL